MELCKVPERAWIYIWVRVEVIYGPMRGGDGFWDGLVALTGIDILIRCLVSGGHFISRALLEGVRRAPGERSLAHCWPVGSGATWEPPSRDVNAASLPPLLALQPTAGDMVLILACSGTEGGHVSSQRHGSPLRPQGSWNGQGHQANRTVSIPPPTWEENPRHTQLMDSSRRKGAPSLRCVQVCMWVSVCVC